jgi:hypothetical protein
MWHWSGDDSYVNGPFFQRFFKSTATSYLTAWQLQPEVILKRQRLMNQRLSQGKFVQSRGIPSYTEGEVNFNVGIDLLASEYRAFESLRTLATRNHEMRLAQQYSTTADELSNILERKAWSEKDRHFMGFFSQDGRTHGTGDAMVLYFNATKNMGHIRSALSYLESAEYLKGIGIEEESYLPQIFYRYGENAAAYDRIMDLTRPDKDRREYPEVSYSVISAIVTGTMGIELVDNGSSKRPLLHSISQLPRESDSAILRGLRIQENLVDLEHVGDRRSTLTNCSGKTIFWQAAFHGRIPILTVDGKPVRADISSDANRLPVSWIVTSVSTGAKVSVNRP